MQRGKRQLHLGLHAYGALDAVLRSSPGQIVEQCRLADTRFARQN
jgi:hypothetical protein